LPVQLRLRRSAVADARRGGLGARARIAAAALAGSVYAPVGLATHYHSFAVAPGWNRAMVMTDMVGAHLFHRWKGYWGTAAAMNRSYAGGEVVPVLPSARSEAPAELAVAPPTMAVPPLAVSASDAAPTSERAAQGRARRRYRHQRSTGDVGADPRQVEG
jgi:hypothetical protein